MYRDIGRIIWTALALVGVVLILVLAALGFWKAAELVGDRQDAGPSHRGTILQAIEHVNKQIFIQHNLVVDIEYTDAPEDWLRWLKDLGIKQDFVFLVWGRVPAGFDLQRLNENDIWVSSDGKRIQLTLPPPIVFKDNVSIDFDRSRIYSWDTCPDFLCQDPLEAYQKEVMPKAVELMIEAAHQYEILEQAARDGKAYYEQFLRSMGFEEVQVIVTGYALD